MRLMTLAVYTIAFAATGLPSASTYAQNSVAYQINPTHTGSTSMAGFGTPLECKWSVDLGAPVSYPLAAQGKVFTTTATSTNFGAYTALSALDAATGETAWRVQFPSEQPTGTACYDDGKVFMFVDNFYDSRLMAFEASTGAMLWNSPLVGQYSFSSPPTAGNGMVYLSGGGTGGDLYAVRQSDGVTAWKASVNGGDVSSAVVTNSGVYVSFAGPQTYMFDPMTGRPIWHFDSGIHGGGGKSPVLSDGKLYVRSVYGPYFGGASGLALDALSGHVVGSFAPQNSGDTRAPIIPAFDNGVGIFIQGFNLTARDISTGSALWTRHGQFGTAPVIINGIVYLSDGSNIITAFDEMNGAVVQTLDAGAFVTQNDEYFTTSVKGFGAGQGLLLVPAGNRLVAFGPKQGAVPEPGTAALIALALPVLIFRRRSCS